MDFLTYYGVQQVASVCDLCAGAHETNLCAIYPDFSWSNNQGGMLQPQQPYQQFQGHQYGAQPYNPQNFHQQQVQNFQQQYAPWQPQLPGFQQQQSYADSGQSTYHMELEELRLMFESQADSLKTLENQIGQIAYHMELEELRLISESQADSLKTLENQFGQIANALLNRPQGTLPSDTEINPGKKDPKKQVHAVTLRSGKVLQSQNEEFQEEEKNKNFGQNGRRGRAAFELEDGAGAPQLREEKLSFDSEANSDSILVRNDPSSTPIDCKSDSSQNEKEDKVFPPPPFPKRLLRQKFDKDECFKLEMSDSVVNTENEEQSVLSEHVEDSDEEEECELLGLADLWDSKVLIDEVVSWSNLEDSAIESFLEEDVLLAYESNICSKHEAKHDDSSFDPTSVVTISVDIDSVTIAKFEEWPDGIPHHKNLGYIIETIEGDNSHESLGLDDHWDSRVRLKPSFEEALSFELKPLLDHWRWNYDEQMQPPIADFDSATFERLEEWSGDVTHYRGLVDWPVFGAHHLPPEDGGHVDT